MISDAISVVGGRHTDRGLSSPPTTRIVVLLASGAEAPRSVGEGAPFVIGRTIAVVSRLEAQTRRAVKNLGPLKGHQHHPAVQGCRIAFSDQR